MDEDVESADAAGVKYSQTDRRRAVLSVLKELRDEFYLGCLITSLRTGERKRSLMRS